MNTQETYQERYSRAKARVEEIRSFYSHLIIYVIINACIAAFNYYLDEWRNPWFLFPLAGWGIGLIGHALGTFNMNPFVSRDWEERKIKELMEKDKNQNL